VQRSHRLSPRSVRSPRRTAAPPAEAYVNALCELAHALRFRLRRRLARNRSTALACKAAAYLASYFASGRGRKMAITDVLAGDLPRLVGRDLTRATGCTMRSLRHSRRLWASRNRGAEPPRLTLDERLAAAAMLPNRRNKSAESPAPYARATPERRSARRSRLGPRTGSGRVRVPRQGRGSYRDQV
jgi:hypothetical protein